MIELAQFDGAAQRILVEARGQARRSGRASISSRHLLAGCLRDPQVHSLFDESGVHADALLARVDDTPRPSELLETIGIDVGSVERVIPPGGPTTGMPLRRSVLRPLRITLGHPPADTPFAGSGRKVLEVALWNARRHREVVSPFDLVRGILSDSRDPAYQAILRSAPDGLCSLLASL